MAEGDPVVISQTAVAAGASVIVDGSSAATGAIDVTELGGTGDATVYREVDTAGDDSWATSVPIDQLTGNWHSQKNIGVAATSAAIRFRVENTSGAAADYYLAGYEVADGA